MRRLCIALLVAIATAGCSGGDAPHKTRVVLITLDTLRYDRFEGTPSHATSMPLLRERAKRGMVFDRYYTVAGVTQAAHATLFSGLQPWEHGITRNGVVLADTVPSIVETFAHDGFETRAVVASFPLARRFGFARGFDEFSEDFSHNLSPNKTLWEGHWRIEAGAFFALGDSISRHALDALDQASADKQFFWFHYFDPHAPYGASSGREVVTKRDILDAVAMGPSVGLKRLIRARELYDADVRALDRALDHVLQRLEKDAAHYDTHVFVVADHGESLGEGDSVGHGARLNDAELHVPAFILSPKVRAETRDDVVGAIDVAPTLLSLADIESERGRFAGRDLTRPAGTFAPVFALRRTSPQGVLHEQRLDGKSYSLEGYLFGEIDAEGTIHRGNSLGILASDASPRDADMVESFAHFEAAIEKLQPSGPLSAEDREGLKALGYVE